MCIRDSSLPLSLSTQPARQVRFAGGQPAAAPLCLVQGDQEDRRADGARRRVARHAARAGEEEADWQPRSLL
eukprot:5527967-Pleurochrysis_carterae.AAC.1